MLAAPGLSSYGFTYDNWGANPATNSGTSVVPGASNAEGSWTQVASSANITRDCHWIYVSISAGFVSASQKDHLVDIGVDNAGGSSYTAVISNIVAGESAAFTNGPCGHGFLFPLLITSGSSVAVRIQGNNATAGTVRVTVKFWGDPSNPENIPLGQFSETIGTIASSGGVGFTPGNAADGAWVSLGTTVQPLWWWQLCVQLSTATAGTNLMTYVDLAWGDATNKNTIQRQLFTENASEMAADVLKQNLCWLNSYQYVPAGGTLYVRGRCSAAPTSGWNAVAVGVGG